MLVLLDECLPVRLRHHIEGHDVRTAEFMGWKGVKNGTLLGLMRDAGIEVLVTIDANLEFQQNVRASGISVIHMQAPSNRIRDLAPIIHCCAPPPAGFGRAS
jgi:hypothetical protein